MEDEGHAASQASGRHHIRPSGSQQRTWAAAGEPSPGLARGQPAHRPVDLGGEAPRPAEDVPSGYHEYLALLQERNRLLKRLRHKDERKIEQEKQERGFSLYVNGANNPKSAKQNKAAAANKRIRSAHVPHGHRLAVTPKHEPPSSASSATSSTRQRRNWSMNAPISIRPEDGDTLVISPPRDLSGNYEDDFDDAATEEELEDSQDDGERSRSSSTEPDAVSSNEEDEDGLRVTLDFDDVCELRKSLELSGAVQDWLKAASPRQSGQSSTSEVAEDLDDADADAGDVADSLDFMRRSRSPIVLEFNRGIHQSWGKPRQFHSLAAPRRAEEQVKHLAPQQQVELYHTLQQLEELRGSDASNQPTDVSRTHHHHSHHNSSQPHRRRSHHSHPDAESALATDSPPTSARGSSRHSPRFSSSSRSTHSPATAARPSHRAVSDESGGRATSANTNTDAQPERRRKSPVAWLISDQAEQHGPANTHEDDHQRTRLLPTASSRHGLRSPESRATPLPQQTHLLHAHDDLPRPGTFDVTKAKPQSKRTAHTVCLCLESSWSDWEPRIGLTEVQFLDDQGRVAALAPGNVTVDGRQTDKASTLINGRACTTNPKNMWQDVLPEGRGSVKRIEFVVPGTFDLATVRLWNYNEHNFESYGVKQATLFVNNSIAWQGVIPRSKGVKSQVGYFDIGVASSFLDLGVDEEGGGGGTVGEQGRTQDLADAGVGPPASTTDWMASAGAASAVSPVRASSAASGQDSGVLPSSPSMSGPFGRQRSNSASKAALFGPLTPTLKRKRVFNSHTCLSDERSGAGSLADEQPSDGGNVVGTGRSAGPGKRLSSPATWMRSMPCLTSTQSASDPDLFGSSSPRQPKPPSPDLLDTLSRAAPSPRKARPGSTTSTKQKDNLNLEADPFGLSAPSGSSAKGSRPSTSREDIARAVQEASEQQTAMPSPRQSDRGGVRFAATPAEKGQRSGITFDSPVQARPTLSRRLQTPHRQTSNRPKLESVRQQSLEESLDSLSFFKLKQAGRLGALAADAPDEQLLHAAERQEAFGGKAEPAPAPEPEPEPEIEEDVACDSSIPVLPTGSRLTLDILTTWGDKHYVGLTGIQVFDADGQEVTDFASVAADPADVNVLPGYDSDPRVVSNLVDGINHTCNDLHMWLCPFCPGTSHVVTLEFHAPTTLSMLRIWNYNKSRIHSTRGARDVVLRLDGRVIFKGEVCQASGNVSSMDGDSFGEVILFTTDPTTLAALETNDSTFHISEELAAETGDEEEDSAWQLQRPSTSETVPRDSIQQFELPEVLDTMERLELSTTPTDFSGKIVQFNIESTWGDQFYLGLTALEVLTEGLKAIPIRPNQVEADPRDLHHIPGCEDDTRTLDKLFDGTNITTDDAHMWLIPFTPGGDHFLTIDLGKKCILRGFRVWNYNKNEEDADRGAQMVRVFVDDREISGPRGFCLRKAPGQADYDFGQTVLFENTNVDDDEEEEDAEDLTSAPWATSLLSKLCRDYILPRNQWGFQVSVLLLTTHGDQFYIGLNGVELLDSWGQKIPLTLREIHATPSSINELPDVHDDVRTVDKLIDGNNDTYDDRSMWLAPFNKRKGARIDMCFDSAISLGAIKFWNYSKTPARGVERFQVLLDGRLLFEGALKAARPAAAHAKAPFLTESTDDQHQTVLFSDHAALLDKEKGHLVEAIAQDGTVQLVDEGVTKAQGSRFGTPDTGPSKRPTTSVTGGRQRPK